jgi:hypothetical protein
MSNERIKSVMSSEFKAHIISTLTSVQRDELLLITEMLSDGDKLHTRVLKQVASLQAKLDSLSDFCRDD